MANTVTQLKDVQSRIDQNLAAVQTQLESLKGQFAAITAKLSSMQTENQDWAGQVTAAHNRDPDNPELKVLKAARDRVVSEFVASKAEANRLHTAVNGV